MTITFTARHTPISPEIKAYCEKRLKAIEKKLGYAVEAEVILSVEKYRNITEIHVKTMGASLNTVEETGEIRSSIDAAFDNIVRRIKKEKAKFRDKKRRKSREAESFENLPVEENRKKVIRSRSSLLKPLSVEEAIIQLESNRNEVFMFRMFDSEKWAVVYRRTDGHYGLIEPE